MLEILIVLFLFCGALCIAANLAGAVYVISPWFLAYVVLSAALHRTYPKPWAEYRFAPLAAAPIPSVASNLHLSGRELVHDMLTRFIAACNVTRALGPAAACAWVLALAATLYSDATREETYELHVYYDLQHRRYAAVWSGLVVLAIALCVAHAARFLKLTPSQAALSQSLRGNVECLLTMPRFFWVRIQCLSLTREAAAVPLALFMYRRFAALGEFEDRSRLLPREAADAVLQNRYSAVYLVVFDIIDAVSMWLVAVCLYRYNFVAVNSYCAYANPQASRLREGPSAWSLWLRRTDGPSPLPRPVAAATTDRGDKCTICMDDTAACDHACIPCGHRVYCRECAGIANLRQCPKCRAAVASVCRIW